MFLNKKKQKLIHIYIPENLILHSTESYTQNCFRHTFHELPENVFQLLKNGRHFHRKHSM